MVDVMVGLRKRAGRTAGVRVFVTRLMVVALVLMAAPHGLTQASAQALPRTDASALASQRSGDIPSLTALPLGALGQSAQDPREVDATRDARRDATQPTADTKRPTGAVAELESLIQTGAASELRTTYNGSFGASLLLDSAQMRYYAALFEGKQFLRVLRYENQQDAEATYRAFVGQSAHLADLEIRRVVLAGENRAIRAQIAAAEDQAGRLATDLRMAAQQAQRVSAHQKTVSQQEKMLAQETSDARAALDASRRRVRDLQRLNDEGVVSTGADAR